MLKPQALVKSLRRQPWWRLALATIVVVGAAVWLGTRGGKSGPDGPTFAARRGPLEISVMSGGSLQALESQEVKCRVRVGNSGTKILKIVDEGYLVTEEDVKNKKVLVELDSSDIEQQMITQEIQYQSALANMVEAEQNYEIQLRQNQSDVMAAEQTVRFARMDLDKFLGAEVTAKIVRECGLDVLLAAAMTNVIEEPSAPPEPQSPTQPGQKSPMLTNSLPRIIPTSFQPNSRPAREPRPGPGPQQAAPPPSPATQQSESAESSGAEEIERDLQIMAQIKPVDFSKYADIKLLGDGEAKQKLRKFEDDLQVSRKELGQATTTLEGTKRLFEKGFVTRNEMERDEISYESNRLKVQTAETAQALFITYDFVKQAEEALSKYVDAVRALDKARRVAVSKQAQSKARLRSTQGQHEVQARQRRELREQLDNCVIVAERSGLVVYGGTREEWYGNDERIREGATVRERQSIITIPDMSQMSVNVKIHESYIKKVQKGQKARITVDAFPDQILSGEVTKVAVLPDSQNRWMNPDLKIYNTTITINGSHHWAKPGMSAKVQILVSNIADCIYVPLQAINTSGEKQVCYVARGAGSEPREVALGEFNDDFIEVKSGLREGERVLLRPPSGAETGPSSSDKEKGKAPGKETPDTPIQSPGKSPASKV